MKNSARPIPTPYDRPSMTAGEFARLAGRSEEDVRRMLERGEIEGQMIGGAWQIRRLYAYDLLGIPWAGVPGGRKAQPVDVRCNAAGHVYAMSSAPNPGWKRAARAKLDAFDRSIIARGKAEQAKARSDAGLIRRRQG